MINWDRYGYAYCKMVFKGRDSNVCMLEDCFHFHGRVLEMGFYNQVGLEN